jgi:hypothetical protein
MAIEAPEGEVMNCVVCHTAAEGGLRGMASFAFHHDTNLTESEHCLACHFQDESVPFALQIHSAPPGHLAEQTRRLSESKTHVESVLSFLAASSGPPPGAHQGTMACATCHVEHRGRHGELSLMNDISCQVCHQVRFASFNEGHPPFGPVPRPNGGIRFDHASHKHTHFGDLEFDCRRCHVSDTAGRTMKLNAFSESCAGCHYQGRNDHHEAAIRRNTAMIFQLPELDLYDAAYWPEDAAVGDDELPLMMRVLLAGDDAMLPALERLAGEGEWIPVDWEPDDEDHQALFVRGVKQLIHELAEVDKPALIQRLNRAFDAPPGEPQAARLVEQLASGRFAFMAYVKSWLSNLPQDLDGEEPDSAPQDLVPEWTPAKEGTGWTLDPGTVSVQYRPTSHADPFFREWIETLANYADAEDQAEDSFRSVLRTAVFEELTNEKSGPLHNMCLRCHTMDRSDRQYKVNWFGAGRDVGTTGFGKFDHSPHLAMLRDAANCTVCHKMVESSPDGEPTHVARGFYPHDINTCSSCHAPARADNSCLNCHTYHRTRP